MSYCYNILSWAVFSVSKWYTEDMREAHKKAISTVTKAVLAVEKIPFCVHQFMPWNMVMRQDKLQRCPETILFSPFYRNRNRTTLRRH